LPWQPQKSAAAFEVAHNPKLRPAARFGGIFPAHRRREGCVPANVYSTVAADMLGGGRFGAVTGEM